MNISVARMLSLIAWGLTSLIGLLSSSIICALLHDYGAVSPILSRSMGVSVFILFLIGGHFIERFVRRVPMAKTTAYIALMIGTLILLLAFIPVLLLSLGLYGIVRA